MASPHGLGQDALIFIFGAGRGGEIVFRAIDLSDRFVSAFIDDVRTGHFCGRDIVTLGEFAATCPKDAVVLVASQHWRAIGRQLKAYPCEIVDASAIVRRSRLDYLAQLSWEALLSMDEALRNSVEATVARALGPTPGLAPLDQLLAPLSGAQPLPVFIHGTGLAAQAIRQGLANHPSLYLAGFIDPEGEGFVDFVDVCSVDTFLRDEDPGSSPVIIFSKPGASEVMAVFRRHGFTTLVDAGSLVPSADASTPCVATVAGGEGEGDILCLVDLPWEAALRSCRGDIIAWCPSGAEPTDDLVARAQAIFAARCEVGAVFAGGDDRDVVLADCLRGEVDPTGAMAIFRRSALSAPGVLDGILEPSAPEFDLWCRLAARVQVVSIAVAGEPTAMWSPAELAGRIAVLRNLISDQGSYLSCATRQILLAHAALSGCDGGDNAS
jgi:hypothetical protein